MGSRYNKRQQKTNNRRSGERKPGSAPHLPAGARLPSKSEYGLRNGTIAVAAVLLAGFVAFEGCSTFIDHTFSGSGGDKKTQPNNTPDTNIDSVPGCRIVVHGGQTVFKRIGRVGLSPTDGTLNAQGWHVGPSQQFQLQYPSGVIYRGNPDRVKPNTIVIAGPVSETDCTRPAVAGKPTDIPRYFTA